MRKILLTVLMALPLFACGSTIGDTCSSNGCGSDLTCRADFPGGFCTQSCTQEGQEGGCPEDSVCTRQFDTLLCAPICENSGDCRDSYECNGTTGSNVKACRVKLP
ncbi:hypothetical protein [Hyalangium versicolor]|uniref:hypothetical protein n=1 Tax=Hyalangium versicolor TaxID=2861190 RepID=UPI001CCA4191|nr:hypothetical protein [Hyalangium versicolor]